MRRIQTRSDRSPILTPALCGLCLLAVSTQVAASPAAGAESHRTATPAKVDSSDDRLGILAGRYADAMLTGLAFAAAQQATAAVPAVNTTPPATVVPIAAGARVPANMLAAYQAAEKSLATSQPTCRLRWYHLAGIGKIESGHARGGQADEHGETSPRILGPVLNGNGFAAIRDTDRGALDGSPEWDRAVGPMQFIPDTWKHYGADGNNDGVASPHNIHDAALAAGKYLCSGGLDLSRPSELGAAVFRYNHSMSYVYTVESWMRTYSGNVLVVSPLPPNTTLPEATPARPVPPWPPWPPVDVPTEPVIDQSAVQVPPTEPAAPADPAQPDPSQPAEPTQPVDPIDPPQPAGPSAPTDPTEPPAGDGSVLGATLDGVLGSTLGAVTGLLRRGNQ